MCLPEAGRADVVASGRNGLRGFWQVPEAAPDPTLSSRASLGTDYARGQSFIYAKDDSRQLRRFANFSFVPFQGLEFAYQYRMLDTHSAYNMPNDIRVRGDSNFAAKYTRAIGDFAVGGVAEATQYAELSDMRLAGTLLGQYTWRTWDFVVQAGYAAENANGSAPSPAKAYAFQQAQRNAVLARAAVAFQADAFRPFLEYGTEQYLGAAQSPHRATLGAHVNAGLPGLVVTPALSFGTSGSKTADFPQEPPWRAGVMLSYAVPTDKLYEALFPPPGSFIASITDATQGAPIDGLIVEWNGKQRDTENGRFVYQGTTGSYVLALKADGYLPVSDTVRVEPNRLILKAYGLRRNVGKVRGTVFLDGKPGKAALVLPDRSVETNANGQFALELAPGAYGMTVTAEGFIPAKRSFLIKFGGEVVFDRLELRPAPKPQPKPAPAPEPAPAAATAAAQPTAPTVTPLPPPIVEAPPAAPPVARAEPKLEPVATPVQAPAPAAAQLAPAVAKRPQPPPPVADDAVQEKERQEWLPQGTGPLPQNMESPVFFKFGSSEIDPRAYIALDRLAELLKSDESIQRVVIEGRADAVGGIHANSRIAAGRAEAIYRYLASKGVERSKMATMSTYYRRTAVGQSDAVRALDRRVGFRIERE